MVMIRQRGLGHGGSRHEMEKLSLRIRSLPGYKRVGDVSERVSELLRHVRRTCPPAAAAVVLVREA